MVNLVYIEMLSNRSKLRYLDHNIHELLISTNHLIEFLLSNTNDLSESSHKFYHKKFVRQMDLVMKLVALYFQTKWQIEMALDTNVQYS